jgi:hypothetical protein
LATKKNALVVKEETKLVTWRDLDPLWVALAKVEPMIAEVAAIDLEVRAIKVVDKVTYNRAAELLLKVRDLEKRRDELIDPYTTVLEKMKKFIWGESAVLYDNVAVCKKLLNKNMGEWVDLEERRTAAEREREAAEKKAKLDREAEEQRQKDIALANELKKKRVAEINADRKAKKITAAQAAKLLREAGADAEAKIEEAEAREEEAKENATDIANRVQVESKVGTVAGISKRKYYKFVVTDEQKVNLKYLSPNLARIGQIVAACKTDEDVKRAQSEIGGIEISYDRSF